MISRKPWVTRLSDTTFNAENERRREAAYRRGCHQTAFEIMKDLERLDSKADMLRTVRTWVAALKELRYDGKPHGLLLGEAEQRVAERLRRKKTEETA
jgi:hypothetical protein